MFLWLPASSVFCIPWLPTCSLQVLSSLSVSRYFCEVDVCKYRPNWYSARMEGRLLPYATRQYTLLTFEAPSTVEVDISLYQPSLRWEGGGMI